MVLLCVKNNVVEVICDVTFNSSEIDFKEELIITSYTKDSEIVDWKGIFLVVKPSGKEGFGKFKGFSRYLVDRNKV